MPSFGDASRRQLETVHPKLRAVLEEAIRHRDFTVIQGHRGRAEQEEYYRTGKSKVRWPNSKHNASPSLAVDVAPWFADAPHVRWDRIEEFASLVGFIMGVAVSMGVVLRSGGDWDGDGDHHDQTFMDWPHLEMISWED